MTTKLYYSAGRGRAEIIRLALAAAGIEFTEEFTRTRETFLKWISDGLLPFNQMPVLEIDGKRLAQTGSIVRYLGRKGGLMGQNEDEQTLADMYYETGRDFYEPILSILLFAPEDQVLKNITDVVLPKYLPMLEKRAVENGSNGYLAGSKLTIGDLSVVEGLLVYVEYLGKDILDGYPALQKFYHTVTSEPRIAAFLSGPQRKKKNDENYVREIKLNMGWD